MLFRSATDEAYRLVREQGMAFRDAYVQVGQQLGQLATPDHDGAVKSRTHSGSTGNLGLSELRREVDQAAAAWRIRLTALENTWEKLLV